MNRILLCLALIVCSFAAQAQEAWPTRPVKFIVPSSPGGGMAPMAMVVHPSVPARTLAELVALGKTAPGKLAYGSAGTGSPTFLGVRMLEEGTGARFTHVPYKGVGAAYADLLGGQVQFLFPDVASAISHLKAGKLRALAV